MTRQLIPNRKCFSQAIIPDAKPLPADEVKLGGSPTNGTRSRGEAARVSKVEKTDEDDEHDEPSAKTVRRIAVEVSEPVAPVNLPSAAPTVTKPETVLAAAPPLLEATSPAREPRACVVHVSNLVRPFTVNQLKELLARTGRLIGGKFWIDKVKSSCLVQVSASLIN